MPDVGGSPVNPKAEHSREPSVGSGAAFSSAEGEPESALPGDQQARQDGQSRQQNGDGQVSPPQEAQVQKRKGGRKPIYATSEERKQRNRQAQAAFRERRTEYIKQLEATIKKQDDTLQNLQQSHRSAADECLMLRYKNSLLERILLEKGIDVQSELKKKEITIPTKVPPSLPQPTPIQRAAMNRRHQYSRSASGSSFMHTGSNNTLAQSPRLQHSPTSTSASPSSVRSPTYAAHGVMRPSAAPFKAPPPIRVNPGGQVTSPVSAAPMQGLTTSPTSQPSSAGVARTHPWPSPFETHMQQLEQEYGAHSDIMEDPDVDEPMSGPYPDEFQKHQAYVGQDQPDAAENHVMNGADEPTQLPLGADGQNINHMSIDPFDPMLDADPFGLTASMHFPTQFSFQESSMRK